MDEDLIYLKNEIKILISLDHPGIVKLIDIYEDANYICLVMELMTGGDLLDQIIQKEAVPFSESETREAVKVIIDAVEYCHQKGIVHRDIKPENLLL